MNRSSMNLSATFSFHPPPPVVQKGNDRSASLLPVIPAPDKLQEIGAVGREDFPLFPLLREWLSFYFSGEAPGETIPLYPEGTAFQLRVWEVLRAISPGETVSYGDIARILAGESGGAVPSAQAVGGAVGRNRISLPIPCHRVIGADGALRGYAGGLERKRALLKLEGAPPI